MPLPILASLVSNYYPQSYITQISVSIISILAVRTYALGRSTNRERDLHGRVILLTGAFSPLGSTLLEALARRGAHVIALTHHPVDAPEVKLIIEALRETTKNEKIYAEHCDTLSLSSTRAFCTQFLTGKEHRLDAIIFAHEYSHIGPFLGYISKDAREKYEQERSLSSDCTFLMSTLLLPSLLVAPPERDIRIITLVNPFYAAAIPHFPQQPLNENSQLLREGYRALKTTILTRHLQRVFDALPQAPAPNPDTATAAAASTKAQKSNIVAVSVSPGFSRPDVIAPILRADFKREDFSVWGMLIYIILLPILFIIAKSPSHAIQSVLHALFLPTPFKFASMTPKGSDPQSSSSSSATITSEDPEEILKPGALYSDCSVVKINLPNRAPLPESELSGADVQKAGDAGAKEKDKEKADVDVDMDVKVDGEYGGEALGRFVWEEYEKSLKTGEAALKEKDGGSDGSGGGNDNDNNNSNKTGSSVGSSPRKADKKKD